MTDRESRPAKAALVAGVSAGRKRPNQIRGGNHGLTPEEVADSQRERVLAAMRELVGAKGYQSVPVAEVIGHAGVSRKTFYALYPSKEECFVALYEREMTLLLAPMLQAFEGTEPWVDRLRTALGVLLGALAADAGGARICFVEVLAAGPLALEQRGTVLAALDPLFAPPDPAVAKAPGQTAVAPAARHRAVTAGSVGYFTETLYREVAAGRTAQLPTLRSQLTHTLTLPFAEGGAGEPAPDDAGERAFLGAYGEIAADVLARVSAALAVDESPAARVRGGVAALLEFCAEQPDRARACFVEALNAGPAARERRTQTSRRLSNLFAQPLRELRPSDRIAEVSAIALVGGFHELTYDTIERRVPGDLPTVDSVVAIARL